MGSDDEGNAEFAAKIVGTVLAALITAATIGGFSAWHDIGLVAQRVERLEHFAVRGERFTKGDGDELRQELRELRGKVSGHIEDAAAWKQRILQCERGCVR